MNYAIVTLSGLYYYKFLKKGKKMKLKNSVSVLSEGVLKWAKK